MKRASDLCAQAPRGAAAGSGLRLSWVGPACGGTALRCSFREGGCDASAVPLNAALHRDFSPVRRLRRRTAPRCTALLADPYAPQAQPGRSPASTWAAVTVGVLLRTAVSMMRSNAHSYWSLRSGRAVLG